ncbi:uncharacterized protein N7483_009611 [Penicillium malachiteum]|uniref:uncharacterized protein n=1 Tax=Penicillium malachiteum TaxID=1324776 RepID=UPI0025473C48|nr:uncharacterized protein N7483_009611 [Penicillium malachiteum]KAJ5721677.1 hypothetical protein N7483_009611 [Penicillium malachiteum]
MPQHVPIGDDAFKFDLAALQTGVMHPEMSSSAIYSSDKTYHHYRDDWRLFELGEFVIHKGPLHLAEGTDEVLSWPISVTIPLEPSQTCRQGHIQDASFVPLEADHPAHHTLPGSFYSHGEDFGSDESEDLVEYFLQAKLRYEKGHKQFDFGNHHRDHEAVRPIYLRHPIPHDDFIGIPKMFTGMNTVVSQRLLPGMEEADLSFKQNFQKFFHSSKVPRFQYTLRFTVPTALHLDDPTPLPIQLEIQLDPTGTSDSIKDVDQNIQIREIKVSIRSQTDDRAPGDWNLSGHNNEYHDKTNLNLERLFAELESPLVIHTGKRNEPIHIGNVFQLTLHRYGLKSRNRSLQGSDFCKYGIQPSFLTYNIRHHHMMEWKISLSIAGEDTSHKYSLPVQVIGPA